MDRSPFYQQDLPVGYCDIATGGRTTMSLMPGGVEDRQGEYIAEPRLAIAEHSRNPDNRFPGVRPAAELTYIDGLTPLDIQSFSVDTHAGQFTPGVIPSPESHRAERELPCYPTWNSPEMHTPQVDTCPSPELIYPQSSPLAPANIILPSWESVSKSEPTDKDTSCAPLLPHGSQFEGLDHLPLPQPPPEVTALLTIESSGDVVSPVFARNSPLVPWELPSEIGHFWLGLFKISEVKVIHAYHTVKHLI
jgi:hypothetical protein